MVGAPADSRYSQDGIPSKLCAYRLGERGLGSGVVFLNFPHVGLSLVLPCALLALFAPVCAVSEENWRDVKGADLRALVQDREFGDGVHFAYVFRTDSTFSGMEMGRKERGTWRIGGGARGEGGRSRAPAPGPRERGGGPTPRRGKTPPRARRRAPPGGPGPLPSPIRPA